MSAQLVPLPKQYIAATCPAREVFFAGAAGPGKSFLFIHLLKRRALKVANTRHVFFRRVSKDLDAHIEEAKLIITPDIARSRSDKTQTVFTLQNGSTIVFTHLANEEHKVNHRGAAYATIVFDEASTFTASQIGYVSSRLRTTRPEVHTELGGPKLYLASNPTGVSHYYMLTNYIEPDPSYVHDFLMYYPIDEVTEIWHELCEQYRVSHMDHEAIQAACTDWVKIIREQNITWRYYTEQEKRDKHVPAPFDVWTANPNEIMLEHGITETHPRCFIPAYLADNPYLGPDYVIQLAQAHDPATAKAFLEGDWSVFEGQFFKEFRPSIVTEDGEVKPWHVIDPIQPEPWWPKMCAMDWGYSQRAKLVIGWYAFNPEREEWIKWQELAVNEMADSEVIRLYHSMTGPHYIDLLSADKAMWKNRSPETGKSTGQFYQDGGVPAQPADNDRITGWRLLREMLGINPKTGEPKLRICSNCQYTIRTLPGLVHSERNPEDLDTEGEDHAADEMRYWAVRAHNRGISTIRPESVPIGVGSYDPLAPQGEAKPLPAFLIGDEPDPWS